MGQKDEKSLLGVWYMESELTKGHTQKHRELEADNEHKAVQRTASLSYTTPRLPWDDEVSLKIHL